MVTIFKMENTQTKEGKEYFTGEIRCLSTDEKPTKVGDKYVDNGTQLVEINTGKIYFFDLDNQQWKEF